MTNAEYRAKVQRYRTYVPTRRGHGITDVDYSVPAIHKNVSLHVKPDADPFNHTVRTCTARKPFTGFGNDHSAEKKAAAKSRL